jgi:hypothetical protein
VGEPEQIFMRCLDQGHLNIASWLLVPVRRVHGLHKADELASHLSAACASRGTDGQLVAAIQRFRVQTEQMTHELKAK